MAPRRCLWLTAELPERPRNGGHVYSRGLREALGAAGVMVEVVGLGPPEGNESNPVNRRPVPGGMRPWWGSVVSRLPNLCYMPASSAFRQAIDTVRREGGWDIVVVDHLQMAWVLKCWPGLGLRQGGTPLVFVTQNHEQSVRLAVAAGEARLSPKGLVLRADARKAVALERRMVASADLVTTITDADAAAFAESSPDTAMFVAPPGYADPHVRPIRSAERARRVVIVGSFDWHVKASNFCQFVRAADPVFAAAGVRLTVVGRVPDSVIAALGPLHGTELLGWVDDLGPVLGDCRVAVVAEPGGGGFKMKALDYLFHHVPLAVTRGSVEGIDLAGGRALVQADDVESLARMIVARIDDVDALDETAARAYRWASTRFHWANTGLVLAQALERCCPHGVKT